MHITRVVVLFIVTQAALFVSAQTCCYPFEQPSVDDLRALTRKAYGWYWPMVPISVDNKPSTSDQWWSWTNLSAPGNQKYLRYGGYMRDRPIPRPVSNAPSTGAGNWRQLDFAVEVRRAIQMGLDGFIYETGDRTDIGDQRWNRLPDMLEAAKNADPKFKIIIGPDPLVGTFDVTDLTNFLLIYWDHPSILKINGKMVVAPFYPEHLAKTFWEQVMNNMAAAGKPIFFFPVFMFFNGNNGGINTDRSDWDYLVDGYGSWGYSYSSQGIASSVAHARGKLWMAPAAPQNCRPQELRFWEAGGFDLIRNTFGYAINGNADWVYMPTWNDYTESTLVSPSLGNGYGYADITAYYVTWFKTGSPPPIVREAIYYTHRNQRTDTPYNTSLQTDGAFRLDSSSGAVQNIIEMLAFLISPAELVIIHGSTSSTKSVTTAGLASFKVPIVTGVTPVFQIKRNGQVVKSVTSTTFIRSTVTNQDFMYHSGGGIPNCYRPDTNSVANPSYNPAVCRGAATASPTAAPTAKPSPAPSTPPTIKATSAPTPQPPTPAPSTRPTVPPTPNATPQPTSAPTVASNYIGCYAESLNTPVMNGAKFTSSVMTVETCMKYCSHNKFKYAGLHYDTCQCGDTYATYGKKTGDCINVCIGNTQQECGTKNGYRLSVYESGYVGCFSDQADPRNMGAYIAAGVTQTITGCRTLCNSRGNQYAGLENARECYCANSYGTPTAYARTACSAACAGNTAETCGASWTLQVYRTKVPALAF